MPQKLSLSSLKHLGGALRRGFTTVRDPAGGDAGLARAIAMEPQYILYDEPTTGLDPITGDAINDLILKLQRELKLTSIAVTHDMASAFKIGDRIAMLSRGRIIHADTADNTRHTDHPAVRQFIEGSAQGPLGLF